MIWFDFPGGGNTRLILHLLHEMEPYIPNVFPIRPVSTLFKLCIIFGTTSSLPIGRFFEVKKKRRICEM